MEKKNVLAVCGAGIATSSVVMLKLNELAKAHGLDVTISKCQVGEYESKVNTQQFDLVISTTRIPDIGIPVLDGKPFLTGIGLENVEEEIINILSA